MEGLLSDIELLMEIKGRIAAIEEVLGMLVQKLTPHDRDLLRSAINDLINTAVNDGAVRGKNQTARAIIQHSLEPGLYSATYPIR
jgi:hypothetical protein